MELTDFQKRVFKSLKLSKVVFKEMFKRYQKLGYTSKGDDYYYEVNIAEDAPSVDIKDITMLHEAGHIFYHHIDVDFDEEFKTVNRLLASENKSLRSFSKKYGSPLRFLNICMDLEVNSKVLTLENINIMNTIFPIYTTTSCNLPLLDSFRDYYLPLIQQISEDNEEDSEEEEKDKSFEDIPRNNSLDDALNDDEIPEDFKRLIQEDESGFFNRLLDNLPVISSTDPEDLSANNKVGSTIDIKSNTSESISPFLLQLLEFDYIRSPDSLRLYNRASRGGSNGLLYSSFKRRANLQRKKLGIVIDVSGSMYINSIVAALGELKNKAQYFDPDSIVVTWSTYKHAEFPISKIPYSIQRGEMTDIAPAIEELGSRGFTDIVVYSDFITNMNKMLLAANRFPSVNFYSIVTGISENTRSSFIASQYFKRTKTLFVR